MASGLITLAWHDYNDSHQLRYIVYAASAALIFGGALIQVRRIAKTGAFEPFVVHYAETFIVPAAAGDYTIRPFGEAEGKQCGTIKAFVRTNP